MWPYIYETTFSFVSSQKAKDYIENAGRLNDESSENESLNS
jgi:hypothetical protein